jgi:hypothetical protein
MVNINSCFRKYNLYLCRDEMNKTNRDTKVYILLYNVPLSTSFCPFTLYGVDPSSPALLVIASVLPSTLIPLSEFWLFIVCNMVNRVFLLCTVSCDSFKRFVIPPNREASFCVTTYSLAWDHMNSH